MLRHPLVLLLAACAAPVALAQEIEPRAYSSSPTGATFLALAYARSIGAILTDPSLPVDDVEAEINAGAAGVGHTFDLFGRLASAAVALPYVHSRREPRDFHADRPIRSGPAH